MAAVYKHYMSQGIRVQGKIEKGSAVSSRECAKLLFSMQKCVNPSPNLTLNLNQYIIV